MQKKSITLSGSDLSYTAFGNTGSPVIMLVHGFGEDGEIWNNLVPEISPNYRVIVPDLPGSGLSPYNETMMDIDAMAGLLHELAVHEQAGKHIMLGHSMGGYITTAYAEHYGTELAAFGLVHSSAYADSGEKKAARQKSIAFIQEHGGEKFLNQTIPNLFTSNYVVHQRDKVEALLKKGTMFAPETLAGYYEAMIRRPDRTSVLKNAKVPVLFLAGVFDQAVPCRHTLEQCHLPDISYIHILEKSAHMGMLEEPKEFNKAISNFLNRIN